MSAGDELWARDLGAVGYPRPAGSALEDEARQLRAGAAPSGPFELLLAVTLHLTAGAALAVGLGDVAALLSQRHLLEASRASPQILLLTHWMLAAAPIWMGLPAAGLALCSRAGGRQVELSLALTTLALPPILCLLLGRLLLSTGPVIPTTYVIL